MTRESKVDSIILPNQYFSPNPPNRVVGALEWDVRGMETRSSGRNWDRPGQWLPEMVVWQCSWRDRRQLEAPAGPA